MSKANKRTSNNTFDFNNSSDTREWLELRDPDDGHRWLFDVSFLTSSWTCIFLEGCKGVLTEDSSELVQGCCSYGAHFADENDVHEVSEHAKKLTSSQWQFKPIGDKKGFLKVNRKDSTKMTRLVDGACIFLNRTNFPTGPGCALHQAAIQFGDNPIAWKPDVCWQLPLRREDVLHDDETVTTFFKEWSRKDWGVGGEEFHWWCTESNDAFVGKVPVYIGLKDEIIEMIGDHLYYELKFTLDRRKKFALPHPALRNRS